MKIISKPIEMICSFNKDGDILPQRFRVIENDERKAYNIKRVIYKDATKEFGEKIRVFVCEFEDNEVLRQCEIRFIQSKTQWILYRM